MCYFIQCSKQPSDVDMIFILFVRKLSLSTLLKVKQLLNKSWIWLQVHLILKFKFTFTKFTIFQSVFKHGFKQAELAPQFAMLEKGFGGIVLVSGSEVVFCFFSLFVLAESCLLQFAICIKPYEEFSWGTFNIYQQEIAYNYLFH